MHDCQAAYESTVKQDAEANLDDCKANDCAKIGDCGNPGRKLRLQGPKRKKQTHDFPTYVGNFTKHTKRILDH